jgi:hypothetical protein
MNRGSVQISFESKEVRRSPGGVGPDAGGRGVLRGERKGFRGEILNMKHQRRGRRRTAAQFRVDGALVAALRMRHLLFRVRLAASRQMRQLMQGSHLLHPEEAEQGYEGDEMAAQGVHGFNGSVTDAGIAES